MKRREALTAMSVTGSGALLLPQLLLTGCNPGPYTYALFNWGDHEVINEMADVIIPDTPGVPGAKAADVADFVQRFVSDCLPPESQQLFLSGFVKFKEEVSNNHGDTFDQLKEADKIDVIAGLEDEAAELDSGSNTRLPRHFYTVLKDLIVFGYGTSEIGATKALQYIPVPGKQVGIMPYSGEKAYAL